MSLRKAHKSVYEVVRAALDSDSTLSHVKASIGIRFQGEQNPEVIIQQSSFDINDLADADYNTFELSVFCYANTYSEAAKMADTIFDHVKSNQLYNLVEGEESTLYHLKNLDLFLEYYDEDGYEANVLIRAIEA